MKQITEKHCFTDKTDRNRWEQTKLREKRYEQEKAEEKNSLNRINRNKEVKTDKKKLKQIDRPDH